MARPKQLSVPPEYWERVNKWADEGDRSISKQTQRIIDHYQIYMDGQNSTESYDEVLNQLTRDITEPLEIRSAKETDVITGKKEVVND